MRLISKKIILFICIFIFVFNNVDFVKAANNISGKTILVICSYDNQNEWEKDVTKGFRNELNENDIVFFEYLDSDKFDLEVYNETFYDFLNAKYHDKKIDYIFTIDDEALDFVRKYLFVEDAFCYKINTFFVGVNEITKFSDEEKKYISGMLNIENSVDTIDIVINCNKDLKTIYLVVGKNKYSESLFDNVPTGYLGSKDIEVKSISAVYIEDLEEQLKNIDFNDSVLILGGTYSRISNNLAVNSKEVIERIQQITDTPIYSTLYNYIKVGAIGGVVNNGEKLGSIGANLLEKFNNDDLFRETIFLTPSYRELYTSVFNFRAIRKYNVNPLDCPENSIFLNKSKFDLVLPMGMVYLIFGGLLIIVIAIVFLIISAIINRRHAKNSEIELIEIKTRERLKTESLIIMSHEFRTPLNIIMSIAELLLLKCKNNDMDKEYFNTKLLGIIKNSNRLNRAINNTIDIEKLEAGIMNATFKMYNIVEVVENITDSIVDFAKTNNIEVIFDTEEEEIYTAIDKRSIERIILNLLSNAIKNIKREGSINVLCKRDESNVYISIEDNGVGMSSDTVKHIFEKYYQASDSYIRRVDEGSGLGLYIVDKLIEMHKGTISVESELGIGTKFTIRLPIVIGDDFPLDNNGDNEIENLSKVELSDI